jgi:AcrR family transcriptional regulator
MTREFSGRGDPVRSMALLWRTDDTPRTGRGPKRALSIEKIVAAGIKIADAEGLAAVSMRRVAEVLGIGTMSLYTYVPSKAELIDVMIDTVCGEAVGGDESGDWRTRLERIARTNWAMLHRHPWVLQVSTMTRPPMGPNVIAKYDFELRALDGIGLSDVEMDSVLSLVLVHVAGAAQNSVEAAQAAGSTGMTDDEWWDAYAPLLEKAFDAEAFPLASRVGQAAGEAHGAAFAPEHAFEFGLARVLDGIEQLVRSRK